MKECPLCYGCGIMYPTQDYILVGFGIPCPLCSKKEEEPPYPNDNKFKKTLKVK